MVFLIEPVAMQGIFDPRVPSLVHKGCVPRSSRDPISTPRRYDESHQTCLNDRDGQIPRVMRQPLCHR